MRRCASRLGAGRIFVVEFPFKSSRRGFLSREFALWKNCEPCVKRDSFTYSPSHTFRLQGTLQSEILPRCLRTTVTRTEGKPRSFLAQGHWQYIPSRVETPKSKEGFNGPLSHSIFTSVEIARASYSLRKCRLLLKPGANLSTLGTNSWIA